MTAYSTDMSASVKSDFDILCDLHGGPAPLFPAIENSELSLYCERFWSDKVDPVLVDLNGDKVVRHRHWPWVAYAAGQYAQERGMPGVSEAIRPEEVARLLERIMKQADDLSADLCRIQGMARMTASDLASADDRPALSVDRVLSQGVADLSIAEMIEDPNLLPYIYNRRVAFHSTLARLALAAEMARNDIEHERDSCTHDSIYRLVDRLAVIWQSLTSRAVGRAEAEDPAGDFILFVCRVVRLALETGCRPDGGIEAPNRAEIAETCRRWLKAQTEPGADRDGTSAGEAAHD